MLHQFTRPIYTLDPRLLRAAGRFASPEAPPEENKGDEKLAAPPADKPEDKPANGGDVATRITTLVDERNAARAEAQKHAEAAERLRKEVEQLKANDQGAVVSDLQAKLTAAQEATKTRFDKLLELELAALPDAARSAVQTIPGGSEAQFDWLVANRALLGGTAENGKPKPPAGPDNEKKPPSGEDPGASSAAKAYVASRKPKAGFPGLTG